MNELHGRCALTDTCGNPFHRAVSYIASDEYSRLTRLEPKRITRKWPITRDMTVALMSRKVRTGKNESMLIGIHDFRDPFGVRQRANEDKERIRWESLFLSTDCVEHSDRFKSLVAMRLDDGSSQTHVNVFYRLDLVD